ncbi:hypothetical protein AAEX28_04730 [Lentisphaerota bacterium WC36G]|nr:hypothetical protein LJT99_07590 [Lentisphaerae bacterium WC36]
MANLKAPRRQVSINSTPGVFANGTYTNIPNIGNQLYSATNNIASSLNGINSFTSKVQNAILQDQARSSSAKMSEIYNQFMTEHTEFMNNNIYNAQGHNAKDVVSKVDEFFNSKSNTLLLNLNPQEREILSNKFANLRNSSMGNAFSIKNRELDKAIIADHNALISSHSKNAVYDIANKTSHTTEANESLITVAKRQGWGADKLRSEQNNLINSIHGSIVANSIDSGDLMGAQAQLQEYQKFLNPAQMQKLSTVLQERSKMAQVQTDTESSLDFITKNGGDYLFNSAESFNNEVAKIRQNYSGKEEEERVNYLKNRYNEAVKANTMQFASDVANSMNSLRRMKTVAEQEFAIRNIANESLRNEVQNRFNKLKKNSQQTDPMALQHQLYYFKRDLDRGFTVENGQKIALDSETAFNDFFSRESLPIKEYDNLKKRFYKKGNHVTNDMRHTALIANGITAEQIADNEELDLMLDGYLENKFGIDEERTPEKIKRLTAEFLVKKVTDKDIKWHNSIEAQDAFKNTNNGMFDGKVELSFTKEQIIERIKEERIDNLIIDKRISRARASKEVADDLINSDDINNYLIRHNIKDKYLGE